MPDISPVEEYEELLDIEALRKARAEDDGYRISLEDFLKQNRIQQSYSSVSRWFSVRAGRKILPVRQNPTCSRAKESRLPSSRKRVGCARDNARLHVFQGFAAGLGQVTPYEHGN